MRKSFILLFFLAASCHANSQSHNEKKDIFLDSLTTVVRENSYSDIHSILISKNGKSIYEQYFNAWDKDSLHDTRSSFKSITSLLVGIAIDKGMIKDVNQKVYSFFPDFNDSSDDNTWKNGKDCESGMTISGPWSCSGGEPGFPHPSHHHSGGR
jgi:hypothetical protein